MIPLMFKLNKILLVNTVRAKFPNVKLIYLFGSFASGEQHTGSDLDIAILPIKALDNLTRWQIAQELACELDIDVDLIDLNTASTVLCQQVITTGKRLWGSRTDDDYFAVKTMSMYQHLQEERSMILDDLAKTSSDNESKDHVHE
ncbi:MAG: putative nucleotidyltransferase [Moritella sp.]|jgi:predicted nucleotidyltransferase